VSEMTASSRPAGFDPGSLRRAALSIRHPLARALLVLTFTTGVIDAVSYLGLGRVFTGNMTGNVVLLGFGIAGSAGLTVVGPLISLGAFLVGAGAGGLLADRLGDRHREHVARALAIEFLLVAATAVLAAVVDVHARAVSGYTVIALLALAMGVRNATIRRIGVPDLTTTVLTLTLTGLAADSPATGGSGKDALRRTAAVLAMLAGALAGALLLKSSLVLPLIAAAVGALATWLVYVPAARRGASRP
jgi:uncharacterized membrane protein YoaK (UPF0700 family)